MNRISLSYQIWLLVFNLYILQVKDQAKKTVKEFKGLTSSEIIFVCKVTYYKFPCQFSRNFVSRFLALQIIFKGSVKAFEKAI